MEHRPHRPRYPGNWYRILSLWLWWMFPRVYCQCVDWQNGCLGKGRRVNKRADIKTYWGPEHPEGQLGSPLVPCSFQSKFFFKSEFAHFQILYTTSVMDPGGSLGSTEPPLFVVLRACVTGLVCAHERSRKRSGQQNPPFQNPRSTTALPKLLNSKLYHYWSSSLSFQEANRIAECHLKRVTTENKALCMQRGRWCMTWWSMWC